MIYRGFSVPQRVERDVLGDFDRTDLVKSDRQLLGESGHWDASSKSHVYDIHERLLSARSGRSGDNGKLRSLSPRRRLRGKRRPDKVRTARPLAPNRNAKAHR